MTTLAVIPARGGSTELKRKNLLPVDGTPMFLKSAQAARDAGCQVVVSTDDPEIRSTATVAGFLTHDRGPELADVVVDEVVKAAVETHGSWDGPVLLVQPTVQPITADILKAFMEQVNDIDSDAWSLVKDAKHQMWRDGEWLMPRSNRQEWAGSLATVRELGVRWWQSLDAIGDIPRPTTMPMSLHHLVDIDSAADYRSLTTPRRIALWPIADTEHGMGHLRRCLQIAERLQHHHVTFYDADMDDAARNIVRSRGWSCGTSFDTPGEALMEMWILDNLGTSSKPHSVHPWLGKVNAPVLSLEDENHVGDVTINALYDDGIDWAVIRPEFLAGDYQVRDEVRDILLLFGGTDPTGLTERVYQLFDGEPEPVIRRIFPTSDVPVAEMMHNADILITSAGRTVFEAAAVGVPTIVLAQNLRETTHTHLGLEHGNINLGLGRLVSDQTIVDTVRLLSQDIGLRQELSERGRPDGKGIDRIIHAIEGLLGGL